MPIVSLCIGEGAAHAGRIPLIRKKPEVAMQRLCPILIDSKNFVIELACLGVLALRLVQRGGLKERLHFCSVASSCGSRPCSDML